MGLPYGDITAIKPSSPNICFHTHESISFFVFGVWTAVSCLNSWNIFFIPSLQPLRESPPCPVPVSTENWEVWSANMGHVIAPHRILKARKMPIEFNNITLVHQKYENKIHKQKFHYNIKSNNKNKCDPSTLYWWTNCIWHNTLVNQQFITLYVIQHILRSNNIYQIEQGFSYMYTPYLHDHKCLLNHAIKKM